MIYEHLVDPDGDHLLERKRRVVSVSSYIRRAKNGKQVRVEAYKQNRDAAEARKQIKALTAVRAEHTDELKKLVAEKKGEEPAEVDTERIRTDALRTLAGRKGELDLKPDEARKALQHIQHTDQIDEELELQKAVAKRKGSVAGYQSGEGVQLKQQIKSYRTDAAKAIIDELASIKVEQPELEDMLVKGGAKRGAIQGAIQGGFTAGPVGAVGGAAIGAAAGAGGGKLAMSRVNAGANQIATPHFHQSFTRGAADTMDAFGSAILGYSPLKPEAYDLLGADGAAQLMAHKLHDEIRRQDLDMGAVLKELDAFRKEQEQVVKGRGIDRVRKATEYAGYASTEALRGELGEDSLFTKTMAEGITNEKLRDARRNLGMMIGGIEATESLKEALRRKPAKRIQVLVREPDVRKVKARAERLGVDLHRGDVKSVQGENARSRQTLITAPARRFDELLAKEPPNLSDLEYRERLRSIRQGRDLDRLITAETKPGPFMSDRLDHNQAAGKLFLNTAGSAVLGFDPGVGKTHTATAAAKQVMHDEPDYPHKVLVVAPTAVLKDWRDTLEMQSPMHSVQVVGEGASSTSKKRSQLAGQADFTIVSYESLRSMKDEIAGQHSIVIADELQKGKNQEALLSRALLEKVVQGREQHGDRMHFYGLTGTPIEKAASDLHSMVHLARVAKGKEAPDRSSFGTEKSGRSKVQIGQYEHIARGDKLTAFRSGLDEDLFRLSAEAAGGGLPEPARDTHEVKFGGAHRQAYQRLVRLINAENSEHFRAKKAGEIPESTPPPYDFGGRDELLKVLYGFKGDNQLHKAVAKQVKESKPFTHEGKTYQPKHVIFATNDSSQAIFGTDKNSFDPQAAGGLAAELREQGVKIFVGHGKMPNAQNTQNIADFLAYKGKAVFLTNDKNNAGISLHFGHHKGNWQYGATHLHHFSLPVNNATIQQREARVLRKGAQQKVQYHTYDAGTPIEARIKDQLETELRTQELAANAEQQADTLAARLASAKRRNRS